MEVDEFCEYLLLGDEELLDEIQWTEGTGAVAAWLIPTFENWEPHVRGLSPKQHNALVWRIIGNPLFVGWLAGSKTDLDVDERVAFLRAAKLVTLAIPRVFEPGEPMENGYYMWWDAIASEVDEPEVADVCLEILGELSLHPDSRVQYASLHGLGHLRHPGRPAVVDEYCRRHPQAAGDRWILECREGIVQ